MILEEFTKNTLLRKFSVVLKLFVQLVHLIPRYHERGKNELGGVQIIVVSIKRLLQSHHLACEHKTVLLAFCLYLIV